MGLLAVQYRLVPEAPVLVAANREEYFDRRWSQPSIQSGKPRILCGIDEKSGGTWHGVNQHGMFVGVTTRKRRFPVLPTKSRGILCRELLRSNSAREGVDTALEELSTQRYDGVNIIIADAESGWVIHSDDDHEVRELEDGLTIIAGGDANDIRDERVAMARRLLTLQTLDSPVKFLAIASKVFARAPSPPGRPSMVYRGKDWGTVNSTLIALGKKPRDAIYQFAAGAPDEIAYEDFSPMLRDILSRGLREARTKANA